MRALLLVTALAVLSPSHASAAAQNDRVSYEAHDLGSVDDQGLTVGQAINDHGEVVGMGRTAAGEAVPIYWSADTGFIKIVDLPGTAIDINDKGQVVGYFFRDFALVGFLWTREGGVKELGTLQPTAINNHGVIVGQCESEGPDPCVVSRGGVRRLHVTPGGSGFVTDINEAGDIVGTVSQGSQSNGAVWRRSQSDYTLLQPVSSPTGFTSVIPRHINDWGVIIGSVETGEFKPRYTTIWTRTGRPHILRALISQGVDINNSGVAVLIGEAPAQALAWNIVRGTFSRLPSLGGIDQPVPNGVNNRGQIVGSSATEDGQLHAVIWSPRRVPTPRKP